MSVRRRMRERSDGEEGRVERDPIMTSLCLALVRATFTLLQSQSSFPTFERERERKMKKKLISLYISWMKRQGGERLKRQEGEREWSKGE